MIDAPSLSVLDLYPNPAHAVINVQYTAVTPGDYDITLYNAIGKEMMVKKQAFTVGENRTTLETPDFPRGLYIVKVGNGEQALAKKVMIE